MLFLKKWSFYLFCAFTELLFLSATGRDQEKINHIRKYLEATGMFRDFNNSSQDPDFTQVPVLKFALSSRDKPLTFRPLRK